MKARKNSFLTVRQRNRINAWMRKYGHLSVDELKETARKNAWHGLNHTMIEGVDERNRVMSYKIALDFSEPRVVQENTNDIPVYSPEMKELIRQTARQIAERMVRGAGNVLDLKPMVIDVPAHEVPQRKAANFAPKYMSDD